MGSGTDRKNTVLCTEYWVLVLRGRQCQQTGENRKMISFLTFIAKQITDGEREGAWNMCGEIKTGTEFSCGSLKGTDRLVHL